MDRFARLGDAELRRMTKFKGPRPMAAEPLGPAMIGFFKHSVAKQETKVGRVAGAWAALVPQTISDHCTLDGFTRGTLTVLVDNASHLYDLKQLLLAGLQDQLLLACRSAGLRKINLRPGRPSVD